MRGGVTHVDLQEVRLDQTIQASVSVQLLGGEDAPGVREGGVLSQPLREVTVEALPLEVPEHLDLDVSGMEIGGTLRISDLAAPEGVDAPRRPRDGRRHGHRADEGRRARAHRGGARRAGGRGRGAEGEEGAEGEAAEGAAEPEADSSGGEDTAEG